MTPPGGEPADFIFWRTGQGEASKWTIVADPSAANGRAIAQVSKDRTDYRFPLAVYQPFSGKDFEVSVRFKPVAGTVDEAGGIAVRLLTPDDYYIARANALEDNVREHGIEVTAIRNHMLDDQPRLYFMHFWANHDAKKLAEGLRSALAHVNIGKS